MTWVKTVLTITVVLSWAPIGVERSTLYAARVGWEFMLVD